MTTIDISALEPAWVLKALYDAARPAALHGGYPRGDMSLEDAEQLVEESNYFSFVNGRALHIDITPTLLEVGKYDAANGRGCALDALEPLLAATAKVKVPVRQHG